MQSISQPVGALSRGDPSNIVGTLGIWTALSTWALSAGNKQSDAPCSAQYAKFALGAVTLIAAFLSVVFVVLKRNHYDENGVLHPLPQHVRICRLKPSGFVSAENEIIYTCDKEHPKSFKATSNLPRGRRFDVGHGVCHIHNTHPLADAILVLGL